MADGLSHIGIFPIFPMPCSPGLVVSVLLGGTQVRNVRRRWSEMDSNLRFLVTSPSEGGRDSESRKWERISLRNCGTERSKSISVQRPVSCEREYLDQGRSGPSDIGAEKAARLARSHYRDLERNRKFADSPLEEDGFELSVPR